MFAFALQRVKTKYRSGITQAQEYLPNVVVFGHWKHWIQAYACVWVEFRFHLGHSYCLLLCLRMYLWLCLRRKWLLGRQWPLGQITSDPSTNLLKVFVLHCPICHKFLMGTVLVLIFHFLRTLYILKKSDESHSNQSEHSWSVFNQSRANFKLPYLCLHTFSRALQASVIQLFFKCYVVHCCVLTVIGQQHWTTVGVNNLDLV